MDVSFYQAHPVGDQHYVGVTHTLLRSAVSMVSGTHGQIHSKVFTAC